MAEGSIQTYETAAHVEALTCEVLRTNDGVGASNPDAANTYASPLREVVAA